MGPGQNNSRCCPGDAMVKEALFEAKEKGRAKQKKGTMAPNGALWYRWCWRFLGLLVLPVVPAGTVARGATDCVPHLSFTHQRTAKQSEHGQMMAWMVGWLDGWVSGIENPRQKFH